LRVLDYAEHAIASGSDATAVAYVEAADAAGRVAWGVGRDANIVTASLRAIACAATRLGLSRRPDAMASAGELKG
ncbi:MAG: 2-isopropylmalate synthase, partial [Candidatus Dormibacteraeota bacterium]|nr:2-isopropylmalate synthase [Candidatus Dormibacteraeota bacterium]